MGLREEIREQSKLRRMRQGQEVPEYVEIPSLSMGEKKVRVALVPLTEAEEGKGIGRAAALEGPETFAMNRARDREKLRSDVFHAVRDPQTGDLLFESVEAMSDELEPSDLEFLGMNLATLMDYASPSLDNLTEDDLDFLGEHWKRINLKELTGRQWAVAKLCLSILLPELLVGRLSGFTSTESSTKTNENGESTSDASPS